ncbi:MAG: hypothetical protein RLN88_05460 [Ekhidna sp.]|uniref:hypothetical protein n=1 Tax=Ekhidna sp. TaxID=2608089 RepID=UPI0032EB76C1
MKRFAFALLLGSSVCSFAQKSESVAAPYHHTRLPSNPLPDGMNNFHLVYKLDKLEKDYIRKNHTFDLDKLGIWGLERTENEGVRITVVGDTMSITNYNNSTKIDDKTKYNKVVTFNRALHYTVSLPSGDSNPFLSETIDDHAYVKHGEWQDSEVGAENWYVSNASSLANTYDPEITKKNIEKLSSELSDAIGYPPIEGSVPILRIKKYKKYTYPELDEAVDIARAAFALHRIDQKYMPDICKERLQGALEIWKNVVASKNMIDDKAKVNEEVAALAYQNLILVYGLMDEYEIVDELYASVEADINQYNPKGWESYLKNWKNYVDYRRKRVAANAK